MALKQTNEMSEVFHQNENLQTEKYSGAPNYIVKPYKSKSSGIKYGLSELSNNKFYLETVLPVRKRFKSETEVFNTTIHLNKTSKAIGNDTELHNFANEEKYFGEIYNILSNEQGFEINPKNTELLKSDLNEDSDELNKSSSLKSGTCNSVFQNNMLSNQIKLDLNELAECNFEKKLDNHDIEPNSENDLCKNLRKDKISYQSEIENEFDQEINKCCELLNLDVPKMAVLSTTATKSANDNFGIKMIENSQIHKCKMGNPNDKNQSSDILNPQSNKLVDNLKSMSNDEDNNLRTISVDKKLKNQDVLLNKKEKSCKDNIKLKDDSNLVLSTMVISNSLSTMHGEKSINMNDKFFHDQANVSVEDNSLESEFKNNDKNNTTLKINNILNVNSTSVREPNIFILEMIQNHDNESNAEHLDLTTEYTLRPDTIKFQKQNQEIISQDHLSDEMSSTVSNSGDTLILYDESDIDFDETEEISETNASEPEHVSLDDCIISTYTSNEIGKKDHFILSEKINLLDENHPLDNENSDPPVIDTISNNDHIENTNALGAKVDESFVSEYEISLLIDDADSILSEESIDSEYEVSLLEDDINDEGDQNDIHEKKSDSNISPKYLPNGDEQDEKFTANLQRQTKEFKTEHENDQTANNVNFSEKAIDEVVFENNKSSENINNETEHFAADTDGKINLKLEQSTTVRSEKANVIDDIHVKKEIPENNKGSVFQLKVETDYESQTKNKLILNSSEVGNSEEKSETTNIQSGESSFTEKGVIEKVVKTELDVFDAGESNDVNKKFQLSTKAVLMNEIKRSEEKALIINTNKQLTESVPTNKSIDEKIVKIDFGVSTSSELKRDVENKIPDYYEEEKDDLINPGWNKIKELSTDEERYRQVRDCWESRSIPNPFKNLTYYSYRKNKINCRENNTRETRQHKRHATHNLNENNAKRSRTCTYIFDDRIKSIEKEKKMKARNIKNKMYDEVNRLNQQCLQEERRLQNVNEYKFDPRRQQFELHGLRREFQQRISYVTAEYEQKVYSCCDQYSSEINSLKSNRNEVFQFYNFYKGLNTNEYKDPTILTNAQMQELEEIENIYIQMDLHYK